MDTLRYLLLTGSYSGGLQPPPSHLHKALFNAIKFGRRNMAYTLVEDEGATPFDAKGNIFRCIAQKDDWRMMEYFLNKFSIDVNTLYSTLQDACFYEGLAVIEIIINTKRASLSRGDYGLVIEVASSGKLQVLKTLMSGMTQREIDKIRTRCVTMAEWRGRKDVVKFLKSV